MKKPATTGSEWHRGEKCDRFLTLSGSNSQENHFRRSVGLRMQQTPVPPAYQPDGVEYGAAPVSIQSQGRPAVSPAYPQDAASASEEGKWELPPPPTAPSIGRLGASNEKVKPLDSDEKQPRGSCYKKCLCVGGLFLLYTTGVCVAAIMAYRQLMPRDRGTAGADKGRTELPAPFTTFTNALIKPRDSSSLCWTHDGHMSDLQECYSRSNQRFTLTPQGDLRVDGRCLHVNRGPVEGTTGCWHVSLTACTPNLNQLWYAVQARNGLVAIGEAWTGAKIHLASDGAAGAPNVVWACNGATQPGRKYPYYDTDTELWEFSSTRP